MESRVFAAFLAGYGAMAAVALGVAAVRGVPLLTTDGAWLAGVATAPARAAASVAAGLALAASTIALTPFALRTSVRARALQGELRPLVARATERQLAGLAVVSGVGEELLFRGMLMPVVGLAASALAFGVVHQVRGPGRVWWMVAATAMGLVLGGLFAATGHLAGPLVAHVLVNGWNLRVLRDASPRPPRPLGGLLQRRARGLPPREQDVDGWRRRQAPARVGNHPRNCSFAVSGALPLVTPSTLDLGGSRYALSRTGGACRVDRASERRPRFEPGDDRGA